MTKPEGYSRQVAEDILAAHKPSTGSSDVNIIVIMDESFTDYTLIGEPVFKDPLPNIHSYKDNFFEGKLGVSVFGGYTCNTEYEFLTGNAKAFMPTDAYPYLEYVHDEENSIARDLGDLGYSKKAIHPYYSEEWNRAQVYDYLGFDVFISGVDFGTSVNTYGWRVTTIQDEGYIDFGEGPMYVRGLISDSSCFERVLEESSEQSFVFAVTMQNHGGYEYTEDDFANTEYVSDEGQNEAVTDNKPIIPDLTQEFLLSEISESFSVNQYLTCSSLSDAAFKSLTDALEKNRQKTIVLMFGDHQPNLRIPEHYIETERLEATVYYIVPYILWANFDIEFDAPKFTSPNYLSAILKKNAGLPLTSWDRFRLEMMEEYPVVTTNFILDKNGNPVGRDGLRDYEVVQYMRMFG